jgi:hypothetical protein
MGWARESESYLSQSASQSHSVFCPLKREIGTGARPFDMMKELMSSGQSQRFFMRFDAWYRILSSALFLLPSSSYMEVEGDEVRVRMGWAFRSRFPKTAVASAAETHPNPFSRGVHGFAGRWLVNGSGQGILTIDLAPDQRAYVMGIPVRLRQLMVSVAEPLALAAVLRSSA